MSPNAQSEPGVGNAHRLEQILAEEFATCEALLAAGDAARAALTTLDADGVQRCVQARRAHLERLDALEREAARLRSRAPEPPPPRERVDRLRELVARVVAAEAELTRTSAAALAGLKGQIKAVREGARGLQGYRGSVTVAPRFSDRRG